MALPSTASTFISQIDEFYPVAGKDNSSQGFRDNFKNIKQALKFSDQDVTDIKNNAVSLTNPINDFNNNVIKNAVFQETGNLVYDNSSELQLGDVIVNYDDGNYQIFSISSGTHSFGFINWPLNNIATSITLSIFTTTNTASYVTFLEDSLGFSTQLTGKNPHLFEIRNDGSNTKIYTREYIEKLRVVSSSTLATFTYLNARNGDMVFISDNINKPAYYSEGKWYIINGSAIN